MPLILIGDCQAFHCSQSVCSTSSEWGACDFVELLFGHQTPPGWHSWSSGSCSQSVLWGKDRAQKREGQIIVKLMVEIIAMSCAECKAGDDWDTIILNQLRNSQITKSAIIIKSAPKNFKA